MGGNNETKRPGALSAIVGGFEAETVQPTQYPMDFATLEDRMKNMCRNCGMYRGYHVDDKCLFDSQMFVPRTWKDELDAMQKEIDATNHEMKKRRRRR
jgi:hypothetical protein